MKDRLQIGLAVALLLGLGLGPAAAGSIEARVDEGRLTLMAEAAPLVEVLQAIGDAGGFAVVIRGDLAQPVERRFEDRPLEDALQELTKGHTVIIKHAPDSGDLSELRVIASRRATPAPPASVSATEAVAALAAAVEPEERSGMSKREAFRFANRARPAPTEDDIRYALAGDDQSERVAAIPKVGSLMPQDALAVLSDVLAEDRDPLVRSRAVAALTRIEGDGAGSLLQSALLNDGDVGIRLQAINALAASPGAQRRTSALARAMRDDPQADVRRSALLALQRVGGDWARSYLERTAPRLEPDLRQLAERALLTWRSGN
jgi:hypothetical protein